MKPRYNVDKYDIAESIMIHCRDREYIIAQLDKVYNMAKKSTRKYYVRIINKGKL